MLHLAQHEIAMGNGDVEIGMGLTDISGNPAALVYFKDKEKGPITSLPPVEEILNMNPQHKETLISDPCFFMTFSDPRSIDSLISVLSAIKELAFHDSSCNKETQ